MSRDLKAHWWYYGPLCRHCGRFIAAVMANADEEEHPPTSINGPSSVLRCGACGTSLRYGTREYVRRKTDARGRFS